METTGHSKSGVLPLLYPGLPTLISNTPLVTKDKEKAEVPNNFSASVLTGSLSSHTSRADGLQGSD